MFDKNGYAPKDLVFGKNGRRRLIDGIVKISSAVKSTLGPGGNTVLIESPNHTNGITVTKDGVTVAKSVDLFDPVENLAVKMMKEAADRTATAAGDGTTTSIILTEALVVAGTDLIGDGLSRIGVLRAMSSICEDVVAELKLMAVPVTPEMLHGVATISANNDEAIGEIIADAYRAVGSNGIVTIEKSQTSETYSQVTKGMRISRGYTSPMFVNDHQNDDCVMSDVYVLVSDVEINSVLQLEAILKPIITDGKKLLIISPCSVNVVNTIAANVMKGNVKACVIAPPSFGYKQNELMQDIALSLGATYFSEKTGEDLSLITLDDLGHAAKVIVSRDSSIVVKSDVKSNPEEIEARVEQLWGAHAIATKKADKDFILERIASLVGGIGIIYVGGNTDLEQKELYDRVEDAVCAVKSALEEGIIPGAGKALYDIATRIELKSSTDEMVCAKFIMCKAMTVPMELILENSGIRIEDVAEGFDKEGYGYNVKTGLSGNLIEMGVVDPVKVTRSALENAVSVATTILSTNAIITMGRSFEISNT
jgi:chaperonin GroEL